jgi:hypothetical protein
MKILVYSNLARERLGASYARALALCGHDVDGFGTEQASSHLSWWLRSRLPHRFMIKSLKARESGAEKWTALFEQRVRETRPDLVLVLGGSLLFPRAVDTARRIGSTLAVFHPDNPLARGANHRPECVVVLRLCDEYFIWSKALASQIQRHGARRVHYLPFAWDPEVFPPQCRPSRYEHDVVFVGGWSPRRERFLETVASHFDLKIWGPGYWKTRTRTWGRVRQCWQGSALGGEEAAELIARAKITLNVLRGQNLPDGTNMRTFEVPGCRGFLLADRTSGAEEIFPEDEAGAYFGTPEELCDKISFYLSDDTERETVVHRAHKIVADHHQYSHRAREVIECCFGASEGEAN